MGIIRKIREANEVIKGSGPAVDKKRQDELAKKRQQKQGGRSK